MQDLGFDVQRDHKASNLGVSAEKAFRSQNSETPFFHIGFLYGMLPQRSACLPTHIHTGAHSRTLISYS